MPERVYSPRNFDGAIRTVRGRVLGSCAAWAPETEREMRRDAPWSDRGGKDSVTGKTARESLEVEVAELPDAVLIVARSTRESTRRWKGGPHAPVGGFLELSTRHMRKFPTIRPTLEAAAPRLVGNIKRDLRG